MLIDFLSQYMNKKSVRTAYARDPYKTLRKYGVTDPQLAMLASEGLEAAVAAEVRRIVSRDIIIHPFGWAVPAMEVTGFDPPSTEQNKPFTLTVYGKRFEQSAKVAVAGGATGAVVDATSTEWSRTKLVGTMPGLDADDYTVGAYYDLPGNKIAGAKATAYLDVYDPATGSAHRERSSGKPRTARKPARKPTAGQRRAKHPAVKRPAKRPRAKKRP